MVLIRKTLSLGKNEYYETHLLIINGVLPARLKLTPMEVKVLAAFMALEGDVINTDRFCTSARKIVKNKLDLSDGGLGNYIKSFREKRIIVKQGEIEVIIPLLIPEADQQEYNFKLIKN